MNIFDWIVVSLIAVFGIVALIFGALALNIAPILLGLGLILAGMTYRKISMIHKTNIENYDMLIRFVNGIYLKLEGETHEKDE